MYRLNVKQIKINQIKAITAIIEEAERFITKAKTRKAELLNNDCIVYGSPANASMKRAALDLYRELPKIQKIFSQTK